MRRQPHPHVKPLIPPDFPGVLSDDSAEEGAAEDSLDMWLGRRPMGEGTCSQGLGVWGLGFGVWGLGFGV